ncbi:MAG TPA: putative zinc-binding metallopeptidase [Chitinophagaceae bacterium]|jgi:hypothetical protein|nr:putative zinc-binding metallopeptidase [Chitinophagaceae bacterium]HMU59565.1 putative zinc-binding metallopeptidase [Chitinophagaceae bacterium]
MKYAIYTCIVIISLVFLNGCVKEEDTLTASGINEFGYHVPQGNNPYDQRIVNYYNRYGVYMLYKFTKKDAYWSITKWDSLYRVIEADTAYVSNQLDLIDSTFFRYYHDSTLRKYFPVKFLLCSSIKSGGTGSELDGYLTGASTSGYNYQTFIANWGSSRILNIRGAKDSAVIFRGNINYGFLRLMDLMNRMGKSDKFIAVSDYTTAIVNTTQAQRYKRGFLSTTASTTPPSNQADWYNFLQAIVQNPYNYLTNATGINANTATYQGILTPVKDSSGMIRRKYDAMVNYYKNIYNIDLTRIGDGRP